MRHLLSKSKIETVNKISMKQYENEDTMKHVEIGPLKVMVVVYPFCSIRVHFIICY